MLGAEAMRFVAGTTLVVDGGGDASPVTPRAFRSGPGTALLGMGTPLLAGACPGAVQRPRQSPPVNRMAGLRHPILRLPDVAERLRGLGIMDGGGAPQRLADMTRADWERFGRLTREMGIRADQ